MAKSVSLELKNKILAAMGSSGDPFVTVDGKTLLLFDEITIAMGDAKTGGVVVRFKYKNESIYELRAEDIDLAKGDLLAIQGLDGKVEATICCV